MVQGLDMSLDDLIKKNKPPEKGQNRKITSRRRRRRDSAASPYPTRLATKTTPYASPLGKLKLAYVISDYSVGKPEPEANLYVSNLHYHVSDKDIQMLFSEVGEVKSCGIHYDSEGRSKGTAEVVFVRKSDAIAAIKRYNNSRLDGRALTIELIGLESTPPSMLPPVTTLQMVPPIPPTVAPWQMAPFMAQTVPHWQMHLMPQTVSPWPRPGLMETPNYGFREWHHEGRGRGILGQIPQNQRFVKLPTEEIKQDKKQDKKLGNISTEDLDADLEEYLSKRNNNTPLI